MKEFIEIISNLTIYVSFFLALLFLVRFKQENKTYKLFTVYLVWVGVIQVSSYIVGAGYFNKSNLYFSHFYFIGQLIILSYFFSQLLKHKIPVVMLWFLVLLLAIQYIDNPMIFLKFNAEGMIISHLILVIYAVWYFIKTLGRKAEFLLLNIGIFFYLLSSSLIFASGNLLLDLSVSKETKMILFNTNVFLYLIFQIIILTEWYFRYKNNSTT